jgi:hypothetical protein
MVFSVGYSWLTREPWPRRSTIRTSITSVAGAILVNAPTLGGWYLLQGQAVAISRTTGIYAFLFSRMSRRESTRGKVVVIERELGKENLGMSNCLPNESRNPQDRDNI